jgi:hypothetical protein
MEIKQMQEMARDMVGDGKEPNVFFISQEGVICTVTTHAMIAYDHWKALPRHKESAFEDRLYGVICTTESQEGTNRLIVHDEFNRSMSSNRRKNVKAKINHSDAG